MAVLTHDTRGWWRLRWRRLRVSVVTAIPVRVDWSGPLTSTW